MIFAVVAGLAMLGGGRRGGRRYRPGRPYEFTPVWFLANPGRANPRRANPGRVGAHGRELTGGAPGARALSAGVGTPSVIQRPSVPRGTGGASDRW